MKHLILFYLFVPVFSLAQRAVIYNLPDANLSSNTICGKSRVCDPGPQRGIVYRFAKSPYSPDVDDNSTLQSIAASILGQAVSASEQNSEVLNVCSNDGMTSKITINDVTASGGYGVKGRSFSYSVKKKTTIDANIAAQANVDELIKLNNVSKELFFDTIKADLEAIYNKIKASELIITANYSEWSLKQSTINRIKNAPEFNDCREKLKLNNWAYITDIGVISYNISLNGENIRKLGAGINGKLKREGLNIDIGALIEREVHKAITSNVQGYQIIGWRKSVL